MTATPTPTRARERDQPAKPGSPGPAPASNRAATGAASATALINEAMAALAAGDHDRSYQALVEVVARIERGVPIDPTDAFDAAWLYVNVLLERGETQQAARVFADLSTGRVLGWYQTAMLAVVRGRLLAGLGHWRAAEICLHEAAAEHPDPGSPARWPALLALAGAGTCAAALGRLGTAEERLHHAYTRMVADFGHTDLAVVQTGIELADVRVRCGATTHLPALLDTLDDGADAVLGQHHPLRARLAALRATVARATTQPETVRQPGPAPRMLPEPPDEHRPGGGTPLQTSARPLGMVLLMVVLVFLTVIAATAVAVATVQRTPSATPSTAAAAPPAAHRAAEPPASEPSTDVVRGEPVLFPPPTEVRITHDTGATVTVLWTEHSGGTRPAVVTAARVGAPSAVAATVQAATSRATLTGLDPRASYCVAVATLYSPTITAWSQRVCTNRPTPSAHTLHSTAADLPRKAPTP